MRDHKTFVYQPTLDTLELKKGKGTDYVLSSKSKGVFHFIPKNPTNNFKFKNCLFGATNLLKNSNKEKYVYHGCGITFDNAGSFSFDNDLARNIITFGVDNSLSSHSNNRKNNLLILCEGPTYGINESFGFCLSLL